MMNVGIVIAGDIDAGSGGFYYDRRLRERLLERGHEVAVVSVPWRNYGGQLLGNVVGIGREIRDRNVDIVLEDGLAHPSLLSTNRRLEVPVAALVHMLRTEVTDGYARSLVRSVERRFLDGVDAAIYNSEATRTTAQALSKPGAGIVVTPGGDRFDSTMTPKAVHERARSKPLEIRFVGNVVERKGLHILIEGLADLDTEWRLTVVGETEIEPDYVESIRRTIDERGLADRVEFIGRVPDAVVERRLRTGHVLAVPSLYEPFGMVHLEAMAFGCVPIATTNGGPSEFIDEGRSGFVVPPDDPGAITERLHRLIDRDRLAELGVDAMEAFERQPTWEENLDRAVDFLEDQCRTT